MNPVFCVTIDTECDKSAGWKVQQPLSYQNITDGVGRYLQPLFERYQVKPTYLLSPEIMMHASTAAYFKTLTGKAELGTHLHSEFIEPDASLGTDNTNLFQFELDPETEYQKLENLTNFFRTTFGYNPLSFRAGRFGLSRHTLGILEKLGYKTDSSVTPDTWWMLNRHKGVSFLGAPYQPYFPDEKDFRKKGRLKILEVPVTTLNTKLTGWPAGLKRLINPENKIQRNIISRLVNPPENLRWFRPTFSSAAEMLQIAGLSDKLATGGNQPAVLCMMFHSNEYTLKTSPYSQSETALNALKEKLEGILEGCKKEGFVPATLSKVTSLFK